jgi:hypothetical protein
VGVVCCGSCVLWELCVVGVVSCMELFLVWGLARNSVIIKLYRLFMYPSATILYSLLMYPCATILYSLLTSEVQAFECIAFKQYSLLRIRRRSIPLLIVRRPWCEEDPTDMIQRIHDHGGEVDPSAESVRRQSVVV